MATSEKHEVDWQCNKSLIQCLDHLFTSGIGSDVTFLVGKGKQRITAHKTILICRSPVFYAMFEGPLAEKGEITVPDVTEEVFSVFVRYLYTDEVHLTVQMATPILSVARKYCVDQLVKKTQAYLTKNLTTENICVILEHAHVFMEDKLKEDCIQAISESQENVLKSSGFVVLCRSCVKSVIESDNLAIEESVVYEAVIRWAKAECLQQGLDVTDANKRKVLGDILYSVRFPVMDEEYFAENVIFSDILTSEEFLDITRCHKDKKKFPSSMFSMVRRKEAISEVVERFGKVRDAPFGVWNSTGTDDCIAFSTTNFVKLRGLRLFGIHEGQPPITIGIYTEDGKCVYKKFHSLPGIRHVDIKFKDAIKIIPGVQYSAVIHHGVQAVAWGENGKQTVDFKTLSIRFMNCKLIPSKHTNVHRGQIAGLLLSKY